MSYSQCGLFVVGFLWVMLIWAVLTPILFSSAAQMCTSVIALSIALQRKQDH